MSKPFQLLRPLAAPWQAHRVLLGNAFGMAGASIVTAVLGFAYWLIAARSFPPETVGIVSATIASMGFLGLVGDLGLGTAMMGHVGRFPGRVGALVGTALLLAALCSAVLAVCYIALLAGHSRELGAVAGTPLGAAIYVAGVAITGALLVFDQALMGMLLGRLQFWRNLAFASVKLALLAALALAHVGDPILFFATWVAGQAASVLLLAAAHWRRRAGWLQRPSPRLMSGMGLTVLSHHALNLATQAPGLLLPVLVTYMLSARVNAAFFTAWTLMSVAFLVPASLTTSLYAVIARDTAALARKMRFTLRASLLFSALTIAGCLLLGGLVLRIFNPNYEIAAPALSIVALGMPAIALKYHYIALKRIEEAMASGLPLLGIDAALELCGAALGASLGGLTGLALGWLAASYLAVVPMVLPVWRIVRHADADDAAPLMSAAD
ncbi:MAG TPA: hypothetical protein VHB74_10425 [Devosia sp.]|nr:hypothetical protein [Devosia sp.]